jgi:hypothetical protein
MKEQMHRSYGTMPASGNRAVRRILGDAAADAELNDRAEGVQDDDFKMNERAQQVVALSGHTKTVVIQSFHNEADELLGCATVRAAIRMVADALLASPTSRLSETEITSAIGSVGRDSD